MAEYDRFIEDRNSAAWNRDDERRWRDREDARDQPTSYGERAGSYGDHRSGRSGELGERSSFRSAGYGLDAYGVPSDYNFRGPEMRPAQPSRRASGPSGRPSYSDGMDSFGYSGSVNQGRIDGPREQAGYRANRSWDQGRDAPRHYDDSRQGSEQRGWWAQTRDEVSAWFGDDDAAHRRHNDDLHAQDHRGRGPKGYLRSDERIRDDVNDRLTDSPWLDASDVEVSVSGAEVTLNGLVNRREDKRHAEDIAERVSGVKHVQNNIRLKEPQTGDKTDKFSTGGFGSSPSAQATQGQTKAN